jgi:hypothetical protein
VFAVVAVVVLAATSAWSASLRGPEVPADAAATLQVPPGPLPPRPAVPAPPPDAALAEGVVVADEDEVEEAPAPKPTVLEGPAVTPAEPVLAAPAAETVPAAEPPPVVEEQVIPPPVRAPVQSEAATVQVAGTDDESCADKAAANRPATCGQQTTTATPAPATSAVNGTG